VQSGDGRPGEDDPRRFARLHLAAILSVLLDKPDITRSKVEAEIRALGLFEGPATWELLVWDDLGARLTLAVGEDRRVQADGVDAGATGLYARQYAGAAPPLQVRHSGLVPDRDVAWRRITLTWNGEAFSVKQSQGSIAARVAKAEPAIEEPVGEEPKPAPDDGN
jgi:Ca-activated chloride channel homolog